MKKQTDLTFLDCTLRDGGYYNSWNFDEAQISSYLKAMAALPVDIIEIGFRLFPYVEKGFMGGCAYSTDEYLETLSLPENCPSLAIMINGSDIIKYNDGVESAISNLFKDASKSLVKMVRLACHVNQLEEVLPAINVLKKLGYMTTINLMQIAGLDAEYIEGLSEKCSKYPIDVLYFADSLGSMNAEDVDLTIKALRKHWKKDIGFHGHNNMERALPNTIRAIELGVKWVDSTVLGMGRGPGNTCTEYLAIELKTRFGRKINYTPLLELLADEFYKMKEMYGWGPNPFYFLAGKYGIHPTYIQEMMNNSRYDEQDILAVIEHLRIEGGKHYSLDTMESARKFYSGIPRGTWKPETIFKDKEVLILGSGPGVKNHRKEIIRFIKKRDIIVLALNTQEKVDQTLIDYRIACHPVRLLADCDEHKNLSQPLITPVSMLPLDVRESLEGKDLFDFGIGLEDKKFEYSDTFCIISNSLVFSYALAVINSGKAKSIFMAGFDGYLTDDPRQFEMEKFLTIYNSSKSIELVSITPTRYSIKIKSVYSL